MSQASTHSNTLASWLQVTGVGCQRALRELHLDSRRVGPDDVFVAIIGAQHDGRDYAPAAVASGAAAVLVAKGALTAELRALPVPVVEIPELEQRIAPLAADFYGLDQSGIAAIGVTGTNGKTTVSWLLAQMLTALGSRCAVVGTLGWGFNGALQDTGMTTPDAVSMARIIATLDTQGANNVAIEVSSHALTQGRTNGVDFAAAIFTNLSQDHLDFHGDMAAYGAAKRRLLLVCNGLAVINIDDAFGRRLFADREISDPKLSYSLHDTNADVFCTSIEYGVSGSRAVLVTPWGEDTVQCPLPGDFNLLNMLACITLLGGWGYELDELLPALTVVRGAPGRMELVCNRGFMVIVDYAHTPDALDKVLRSVRRHVAGQLRVVVGCGGNRDRSKRPLMGLAATELADAVIFTSDNPRDEEPEAILADMMQGLSPAARDGVVVEVDRARAIRRALELADDGDVVVIAGKGHEDYQEIGDQRLPFSDRANVLEYYAEAG